MRCGRCGNENAETNRFCGMCGAPLVPQSQAGVAPAARGQSVQQEKITAPRSNFPVQPGPARATAQAPAAGPAASASGGMERGPVLSSFDVARDDELDREPIISGPSFLGLNKPGAGRGRFRDEGRGGGPDLLRSSGNVDYLLEDDEPRRGWGKLLLFLLALVLAGGFGYLRWKQGGFDWLKAVDKKPAAATQAAPDTAQNGADSGGSGAAATTGTAAGGGTVPAGAASAAEGSAAAPTENASPAPQTTATQTSGTQTSGAQAVPAQASQPQASPSQSSPSQTSPSQAAVPATAATPNGSQPNSSAAGQTSDSTVQRSATGAGEDSTPKNGGSDSAEQSSDSDEEAAAPKPVARKPAAAKPVATKPSAAKPIDTVAEAERYVYGSSGVRQDCDRGLRMLKGAAGQSDAKAMISLGALYTTGTCAPRDLPTAYRWFALALHKQPDNQVLQDDLQKLWSQMTQPERQLAIKLSQ